VAPNRETMDLYDVLICALQVNSVLRRSGEADAPILEIDPKRSVRRP
jgi:hypothetical protein